LNYMSIRFIIIELTTIMPTHSKVEVPSVTNISAFISMYSINTKVHTHKEIKIFKLS
jgi:hypothetical protein